MRGRPHKVQSFATTVVVAFFFVACGGHEPEVMETSGDLPALLPQGIADSFSLNYYELPVDSLEAPSYTKNAQHLATLESPRSLDYDHLAFPFKKFPSGVVLTVFDTQGQSTRITADQAEVFSRTSLINLKGSVRIDMPDGKRLETDQLYWDRKENWIFTDGSFVFTNPEDQTVMYGTGLDLKRDFTYFNAQKTSGFLSIKQD
jgi:LPS export ABC transporter protein LptC